MIVGSYDKFSLFPEYTPGIHENARGAITLLYIMRFFSNMYRDYGHLK
jgi:Zn-dependent M28 family amino/carboxypeptidase